MTRCVSFLPIWRSLSISVLLTLGFCTTTANAQGLVRALPASAMLGELRVVQPPEVVLNGNATRLSPGARIRSQANTLVMSATLVGQTLAVAYVTEPHGLVHEVWILNPAEHAAIAANAASRKP